MSDVTRNLNAIEQGDPHVDEELLPLVYGELRKLAAERMAQENPGQTLETTALVHEAYLRLVGGTAGQPWNSRSNFFAAAQVPSSTAAKRLILHPNRRRFNAAKTVKR